MLTHSLMRGWPEVITVRAQRSRLVEAYVFVNAVDLSSIITGDCWGRQVGKKKKVSQVLIFNPWYDYKFCDVQFFFHPIFHQEIFLTEIIRYVYKCLNSLLLNLFLRGAYINFKTIFLRNSTSNLCLFNCTLLMFQ